MDTVCAPPASSPRRSSSNFCVWRSCTVFIGNDVVDLGDPEALPGGPHPRFPSRVCNEQELCRIYAATDPMRMLWTHWAAKESAFKAMRKADPAVAFLPRSFRVELRGGCDGGTLYAVVQNGRYQAA